MGDEIDPTQATNPALSRRAFAVLGAGAAALGGSIAAALAAGDDFGKPHPPIVAEDDPAIIVHRPTLTQAGRSLGAYAALPKRPPAGAIVVVQAIWGVDAQLRDVVRRFAKEGYAAIAPELYAGLDAPNGDGLADSKAFASITAKLADATVDADILAAARWAQRPPLPMQSARVLKVGVTGFCMGGGITLRQAVQSPNAFAAAAMWYGKVRYSTAANNNGPITPIALAYADDVKVSLLGSFGARDTSILPDDVRALAARLDGTRAFDGSSTAGEAQDHYRVRHDFKIYDEAGHAFFDDTRPSYVASAAADAWTRTLGWFATALGR